MTPGTKYYSSVENELMSNKITGSTTIASEIYNFQTKGEVDIIDLSNPIKKFVTSSNISNGTLTIFCIGSTGSIVATEFEHGLIKDQKDIIKQLIPKGAGYHHDRIENNAHSHLRSTLFGSDMTIPIIENELMLGTWQQVVFLELDVHPRNRRVVFQIMGISA